MSADEKKQDSNDILDDIEICPSNVSPINYTVSYKDIDFTGKNKFKFTGEVSIDLKINKDSDFITFNSADIEYISVKVSCGDASEDIKIDALTFDKKKEQTTVKLTKIKLKAGNKAILCIKFTGTMNDQMKGFYRSKYKLKTGEDGYCGITQFESTDARRAFPCWDEPGIKSTFIVIITCPNDLVCLSNMTVKDTKISDDKKFKTVTFDKSPIMSVYLLAWCIGEFESIESQTKRNIKVRVWTTLGNKSKATFALKCGCDCLDFYEQYFGINYPLPKCDMIAVPDFAAGAMENWGLITYREIALLCDEQKAAISNKQYVAIVVCHELAHQWFGNLVTMKWWNELWLNEGFACFMEYLSSDALYPKWNMWNRFLSYEYSRAFELDGMLTSHAVENNAKTAAEADEVFDTISYCKGACVIRMLQSYIGGKPFQDGLSKYLSKFQYSNATTLDLWKYFSDASNKDVKSIMNSWTKNQGFPLIIADLKDGKLKLKQKRYLSNGIPEDNSENDKIIWSVPINLRIDGNKTKTILLTKKEDTFDIPKTAKFVLLNADSQGFYCVKYSDSMMVSLNNALTKGDKQLTMTDKLVLIRDTKALAACGVNGATVQLLQLIISSKNETQYNVWEGILGAVSDIKNIIDTDDDIMNKFKALLVDTLKPIYNKLGFKPKTSENKENSEDEITSGLFRPTIIGAMSSNNDKSVNTECMKLFHKYFELKAENKINEADTLLPDNIKSVVYKSAIKNGGKKEFDLLKKNYLTTTDPAEKSRSLRILGTTQDANILQDMLKWILTSDDVRSQDKVFPFRVISHNLKGRDIAWKFLKDNWKKWFDLFKGGFLVQHLAKMPSGFVSNKKADEVETFYKSVVDDAPQCKKAMNQCIEVIRLNAKWRDNEIKNIKKFVDDNYKKLNQ